MHEREFSCGAEGRVVRSSSAVDECPQQLWKRDSAAFGLLTFFENRQAPAGSQRREN
jgi:hypothetical protein